MRFGLLYEHQLPRPWTDDSERRLIHEALEQVELADRLGIEFACEGIVLVPPGDNLRLAR